MSLGNGAKVCGGGMRLWEQIWRCENCMYVAGDGVRSVYTLQGANMEV